MPVGIGALGADSQKRLQVRLDRARIATPRQAFELDEVEMRPHEPRLPRHDLLEGFLRALGLHVHQKPRLEVAGQEVVRSPSIELERAVILVSKEERAPERVLVEPLDEEVIRVAFREGSNRSHAQFISDGDISNCRQGFERPQGAGLRFTRSS